MQVKRSIRRLGDFPGALLAGVFVTIIWLVLLWHDPLLFWNDDYELSILPVFADVARSWSEGQLPLLSPYSWVCSNLAGEFQYGTFSVFVNAAVVAIWKFPLTFPQQAAALSMTHLFVLAMGGYMLGRGRELAPPFAMMVALVAALNGWIVCWGATDWFGALGAFAWLPWAWWGIERAADSARGRWRFLWPAPFVYLLITGGFPYTVVMFALLTAWLAAKTLVRTRRLASVIPIGVGVLFGVGLSAPAWLALFDYLQGSAREGGNAASHFQWIVPAAALPAFVLPAWTVNWSDFSTRLMPHTATEMACGLVPPAALLAGVFFGGRPWLRRIQWELGLLGLVLLISMLPSANVFRWSFRWLPFLHVIMAVCGAEALQFIAGTSPSTGRTPLSKPAALSTILVLVAGGAMWMAHAQGPYGWALFASMFGLSVIWLLLDKFGDRHRAAISWAPSAITASALLVTYLQIPPNAGVPKYELAQNLTQPAPLDPARLYLSVYPPAEYSYKTEVKEGPVGEVVRLGSTSMFAGLRFVNGYSPILPSGVAREYQFAIHGDFDPGVASRLLEDEAGPEGELARLGVDAIVVASESGLVPQPASEWKLALKTDEGSVFYRQRQFSKVRIQIDSPHPSEGAELTVLSDLRNSVTAKVVAPNSATTIAFSRPYFPGYSAALGGKPLEVSSYRGLIPTIAIPAGASGMLTLVYRPWWLMAGGAIAALTALAFSIFALLAWRETATQ